MQIYRLLKKFTSKDVLKILEYCCFLFVFHPIQGSLRDPFFLSQNQLDESLIYSQRNEICLRGIAKPQNKKAALVSWKNNTDVVYEKSFINGFCVEEINSNYIVLVKNEKRKKIYIK